MYFSSLHDLLIDLHIIYSDVTRCEVRRYGLVFVSDHPCRGTDFCIGEPKVRSCFCIGPCIGRGRYLYWDVSENQKYGRVFVSGQAVLVLQPIQNTVPRQGWVRVSVECEGWCVQK